MRSAHGWVSFLFLFLDCLSRLFSPHRCTAYYVCQYNKVFAKLMSKSNVIDVTSQAGENTQSHYLENISICRICHRRPPWSGYIWVWVDVATLPTNSIKFLQKNQKSKMVSSNLDQFLQLLHVSFPPGLSGTVRNKPELDFRKQFISLPFNILMLYYS